MSSTKTVVLDLPSDWEPWLFVVKSIADGGDTWSYIDPDLPEEPALPIRPTMPTPHQVDPSKASINDLDAAGKETYKLLLSIYKEDLAIAKQALDTIQAVRKHLVTTVSARNIVYINDKNTVYQMLLALKKRLAPTDYARKLELAQRYRKLKTFSKKDGVERWLKDWETTFADGKKLKIPEVADERPLFDFTHAVSTLDSGFSSSQEYFLTQKIRNKETLPDLYDLIEDFRNHYRRNEALKPTGSHSAFATLNGESQDGERKDHDKKDDGRKEKTCLCGGNHGPGSRVRWDKCYYITPKTRPQDWTGKQETFNKINEVLKTWEDGKIKWFIKRFKYDGWKENDDKPKDSGPGETSLENPTKEGNKLGSFTTHSSFTTDKDYKLYNAWTIDNASDIHVCNEEGRGGFVKTAETGPYDKIYSGKTSYTIEAVGTVNIQVQTRHGVREIELKNVALAPGYMTNIVCLDLLNEKGVHWNSENPRCLTKNGNYFCDVERIGKHWVLERDSPYGTFGVKKSTKSQITTLTGAQMHQALGHASPEVISHVEAAGLDIKIDNSVPSPSTIDCETCSLSKATEIVSRRTDVEEPENGIPFDRTTWDMIEMTRGYNGDRYISHFQCRQYLFNLVYTHAKKTDAKFLFNRALSTIEGQYNGKVRYVRLDGETSLGGYFEDILTEKRLKAERTAPDTPAQNGGSERSGKTIIIKTRSMRIEANLPADIWPEIVKAAGYISNRTPVRKLSWKTPFEAVTKTKPRYAHLHPYGCRAYAFIHDIPRTRKLDPRAHIGHLVGYDSTNIFRIWIPSRRKVIRTRDVTFKHDLFYDPSALDLGLLLQEEVEDLIQTLDIPETRVTEITDEEEELLNITQSHEEHTELNETTDSDKTSISSQNYSENQQLLTPEPTPSREPSPNPSMASQQPNILEDTLQENNDLARPSTSTRRTNQAPRRDEISADFDEQNVLQKRTRRSAYTTALQKNNELGGYYSAFNTVWRRATPKGLHRDTLPPLPKTWRQMLTHQYSQEFKQAAEREIDTLKAKGTFEYIESTKTEAETMPLPLKWVFKYKFDENGYLLKYKARLVARGDLQYTAEDTYAATLTAQTFRAVMAIAAAFDLDTRQYDAVSAFPNAILPTPVTCECPEGFEQPGYNIQVVRALYGLKTSPLLWFKNFTGTLEDLGLKPVPDTNCLYVNDWLILIFYVDDIITLYKAKNRDKMDKFEQELRKKYDLRTLGEADHFLGIRIIRDRSELKLWLIQDSYIEQLADRFDITTDKTPKTPLPSIELVPNTNTATPQQTYGYQQRVGSLNFTAVITRPDISKAISTLSQFLQNPSPEHIAAANQTLEYLVGTKHLAIEYSGKQSGRRIFTASSDSAFADDKESRRSSYGFCFTLFGGVIYYKATRGTTVTTSSTEAELLAISQTGRDFIWWKRFFDNIRLDLEEESTIYCDNLQTLRILTKETPKLQTALKHVDIHQNWLRQEVLAKRIQVEWVPTTDMIADGFTKSLSPQRHAEFVRQLNLVDLTGRL